jgi:hypothetical protein
MSACEKCWADAYARSRDSGRGQSQEYSRLVAERALTPCTPREQAGQFWDEETQSDVRIEATTTAPPPPARTT